MASIAITSTGVRQSQKLTVPSTQNTAPVLDFRCLYTHDLRRKQKRWHDGLLRFHTFNKRIMVYDVPRNYIGDTHWRDDGIVEDGDEFELDRGVLIQVGEATGRMEQDLTELLEKRKKPQDQATANAFFTATKESSQILTAVPAAGQASQIRPKSLNALLGTRKGPIGRASLSTKSPHEIHIGSENVAWADKKPANGPRLEVYQEQHTQQKRKSKSTTIAPLRLPMENLSPRRRSPVRPGSKKVNSQSMHVLKDDQNRSSISRTRREDSASRQESHENGAQMDPAEIVDLIPLKAQRGKPAEPTRNGAVRGDKRAILRAKEIQASNEDAQLESAMASASHTSAERASSRAEAAAEVVRIVSDGEGASNSEPARKRIKLQLASRKPRKKLMYRDLLPQPPSVANCPFSSDISVLQDRRESSVLSRSKPSTKLPLSELHQEEQDQLADRLNTYHGKGKCKQPGHQSELHDEPELLGLILSPTPSPTKSTGHQKTKDSVPRNSTLLSQGIPVNERACSKGSNTILEARGQAIPKGSFTVNDTALGFSQLDDIHFSPPPNKTPKPNGTEENPTAVSRPKLTSLSPTPASPPPGCPTHRSAWKAATPKELVPSSPSFKPQSPPIPPSSPTPASSPVSADHPINPLPNIPPPINRPFKPPKCRSQLKKSASDTSGMRPPPPIVQQPLTEAVRENGPVREQGGSAWGKEAWDLFGCGRDGVECTYEEFKRKEGLL